MTVFIVSMNYFDNEVGDEYHSVLGAFDSIEKAKECIDSRYVAEGDEADFYVDEYEVNGLMKRYCNRYTR